MKLLIEAFIVGLSLAAFTHVIKIADLINTKNEAVFMFVVGFLIHLVFELLGMNKWYCKNGAACTRN